MRLSSAPAAASIAAGVLLLQAVTAAAAPQSVDEIANYRGADRQAVLEAGAKKEGEIMVYTAGTQTQPMMDAFGKKYPFLKVNVFRGDTEVTVRRAIEESKAGRNVMDEPNMGTEGLHVLREAGLLQPFYSPELEAMRKEAIEAKGLWANDYESYSGLGYNTKEVGNDVPMTYDDLLNPRWKGKMAVGYDNNKLAEFTGTVLMDKGEAFVRQLGKQQIKFYNTSARAIANLVIAGEIPLSPIVLTSHVTNSQRDGAPIAWKTLGAATAQSGGVGISKKAPHPHATMLFIDYFLGKEGQAFRQTLGYASARTDLQNANKPERIVYMMDRPTYEQDFEKWLALAKEVFGTKAEPAPK